MHENNFMNDKSCKRMTMSCLFRESHFECPVSFKICSDSMGSASIVTVLPFIKYHSQIVIFLSFIIS